MQLKRDTMVEGGSSSVAMVDTMVDGMVDAMIDGIVDYNG